MTVTQQAEPDPQDASVYIWRVNDSGKEFVSRYPAALNPQHLVNATYPGALDKRTVPAGTPLTYLAMDATARAILGLDRVSTIFTLNGAQAVTWTNMPAAKTAVAGSLTKLPLYDVQVARLTTDVGVVGAAGAVLIAQVSTDGVTYVDGPSVSIATPTGLKVSSLVVIPAAYQTDVFFRLAGQGGDGVADPQLRLTTLQVA